MPMHRSDAPVPQEATRAALIALLYHPAIKRTAGGRVYVDQAPTWEATTGHPDTTAGFLSGTGDTPTEALTVLAWQIERDPITFVASMEQPEIDT